MFSGSVSWLTCTHPPCQVLYYIRKKTRALWYFKITDAVRGGYNRSYDGIIVGRVARGILLSNDFPVDFPVS